MNHLHGEPVPFLPSRSGFPSLSDPKPSSQHLPVAQRWQRGLSSLPPTLHPLLQDAERGLLSDAHRSMPRPLTTCQWFLQWFLVLSEEDQTLDLNVWLHMRPQHTCPPLLAPLTLSAATTLVFLGSVMLTMPLHEPSLPDHSSLLFRPS